MNETILKGRSWRTLLRYALCEQQAHVMPDD